MTLIFDSELGGHHLEYIHHLWCAIATSGSDETYLIAVPGEQWERKRPLKKWPASPNITLRLMTESDMAFHSRIPFQKRARKEAAMVKRLLKENPAVDRVIMLNLAPSLPFLPFSIPKEVKVSGIIFSLDYYAHFTGIRKMKERLNLRLMAKHPCFGNVLLLNAPKAVEYYNARYRTDHFSLLVDPVPEVDFRRVRDIREQLGIEKSATVFLHFGAMQERKGTLIILKSLLDIEPGADRAFVFAGKVSEEIRAEFYQLVRTVLERGHKVLVKDEFLDFDVLHNLCFISDCLIAPYLDTSCSSGVIGYGAVFGKPVIGSKDGLLGELIELNQLGVTIPVTVADLAYAICEFKKHNINSKYNNTNTVGNFSETILRR